MQTLAAAQGQPVGIGAATTQKSQLLQLAGNRLADQGRRLPARGHGVVVIGLGAIETQGRRRIDQRTKGFAVATRVGQQSQTTRPMQAFDHLRRPQGLANRRLALDVGLKGPGLWIEIEPEHMHQAALEETADLDAFPEAGHRPALLGELVEGLLGRP